LPGVGISIGFSRLFDVLYQNGHIKTGAKSPADVLVILPNKDQRDLASETAQALRKRGLKVELYHAPQKLAKQLSYAEKKGISHVWFPPFDEGGKHEVKNLETKEQVEADPNTWVKDAQ
jgi:histidyl-tRNA synthetase